MTESLKLPIIDLPSSDCISTAKSIRQSSRLFSLPLEDKAKMSRKNQRGYTPLYAENLDPSTTSKGL
ncbi:hypothetical protein EZV62_023705 [Acer yangbiense]|uniref:Uncharacterized protein n=1 Tax=Acer yangbiense TaxID=1000413 RepID=A0A5C7H2R4_9ROSI|nr:hypothetical protein EZV62_023705 [Acer yangbiense]